MSTNVGGKTDYSLVTLQIQEQGSEDVTINTAAESRWRSKSLESHNRTIILVCCLIVLPMVIFSVIILWLVLNNLVGPSACSSIDFCSATGVHNDTRTGTGDYLVNFPAAKLVFIASLSSTISSVLIGSVMVLYGYIAANNLLHLSDANRREDVRPNPYEVTLLIRVLNADLFVLWDTAINALRDLVYYRGHRAEPRPRMPRVLRTTVVVFTFSVLCSLAIQAADTYLHIVTKAIDIIDTQPTTVLDHHYSSGLDEACLNRTRTSKGTANNTDYWSCAVYPHESLGQLQVTNIHAMNALEFQGSHEFDYIQAKGQDGSDMTILGPRYVPNNIDYVASSFGVSTQCRAIQRNSCDLNGTTDKTPDENVYNEFNCTKERSGIDASGRAYIFYGQIHFMDFHKLQNNSLFQELFELVTDEQRATAANLSVEDGKDVFKNPWNWLSLTDVEKKPEITGTEEGRPYVWSHGPEGDFKGVFQHCESTVWDVKYRVVDGNATILDRTLANSTTTGIPSMTINPYYHEMYNWVLRMQWEAEAYVKSIDELVDSYATVSSRKFLVPFAGVSSARSALAVQTRAVQVVTVVPKSAVWALAATNMLFALFAFVMAVVALRTASVDVHQVHTRLSEWTGCTAV